MPAEDAHVARCVTGQTAGDVPRATLLRASVRRAEKLGNERVGDRIVR